MNSLFNKINKIKDQINKPNQSNLDINKKSNDKKIYLSSEFQLPIYYLDNKKKISENIKTDLEFNLKEKGIYSYLFDTNDKFSDYVIKLWYEYYTYDINFLKETNYLLKEFKPLEKIDINLINDVDNVMVELRNETAFYEKYKFIDNKFFLNLNENSLFLQILTIYNLFSPILSLLIPILMLILPFFLLKLKNKNISISTYFEFLKIILKNHFIGKNLLEIGEVGWDRKIIIIFTFFMYLMNLYQHFNSCYRFFCNFIKIKKYLNSIKKYIYLSIQNIDNINLYCKKTYIKFVNKNNEIKNSLEKFYYEVKVLDLEKIMI